MLTTFKRIARENCYRAWGFSALLLASLTGGWAQAAFVEIGGPAGLASSAITTDVTSPTKPAGLTASNLTTTSFTITWTASADNVGVTGYNIYRAGTLVGSTPTITFDVTRLAPDTNQNMTVKATDAAGNLSTASVALAVRTLAEPPSAPVDLTTTNLKATSFTLHWSASAGGTGGITGYDIYQSGTIIGSTTTRIFAVTGLAPATTYNLTVRSRDTAGNVSPASAALPVTTPADTTNPTRPANVAASNLTTTSFTLTWATSSDNIGVTGYNIYRAGTLVGSSPTPSFDLTGLAPDTNQNMTVKATDAAGNLSAASVALAVRTLADPPSIPTALNPTALKAASFTLRWTASTGGTGGIAGYDIYQNGVLIGSSTTRTFAVAGLAPLSSYSMTVLARDTVGNVSATSVALNLTTPADTTKPSAPSALVAMDTMSSSFTLTWTPSTDNVGVTSYNIYRSGVLIGSSATTSFVVTGLTASTTYTMTVKALDAAGLLSSPASPALMVTTPALVPYLTDFETAQGYAAGTLHQQHGWRVASGAPVVTTGDFSHGAQSVQLTASTPPAVITQSFAANPGETVQFFDFFARPVADSDLSLATSFTVEGTAQLAFQLLGGQGWLQYYRGDGAGGGTWAPTGFAIPLGPQNQAESWVRLTTRLDFTLKTWDLYADTRIVAADIPFIDAGSAFLSAFQMQGAPAAVSGLDDIYGGPDNPLFADINNDGIDDAWEIAHGLSLAVNNRYASPTGNGVSVIQAYLHGTDPNDVFNGQAPLLTIVSGNNLPGAAGQFNVQPLTVAIANASGTTSLANAPVTFTVQSSSGQLALTSAGTPALSSTLTLITDANGTARVYFQQPPAADVASTILVTAGSALVTFTTTTAGLHSGLVDTDGNGLPDAWEIQHFGRIGVDPNADPDGDGLANAEELASGTDPDDPTASDLIITPLLNQGTRLFDDYSMQVRVTNLAGRPVPNVLVKLRSLNRNKLQTATQTENSLSVRTDASGLVKITLVNGGGNGGGGDDDGGPAS